MSLETSHPPLAIQLRRDLLTARMRHRRPVVQATLPDEIVVVADVPVPRETYDRLVDAMLGHVVEATRPGVYGTETR